jgi:hypothetical protein
MVLGATKILFNNYDNIFFFISPLPPDSSSGTPLAILDEKAAGGL